MSPEKSGLRLVLGLVLAKCFRNVTSLKHLLTFLLCLSMAGSIQGQNLVANGDFERAKKTPCLYIFDSRKETISDYIVNWVAPTGGTSDPWFYSDTLNSGSNTPNQSCTQNLKNFSFTAHSGKRCVGIYTSANKYRSPTNEPVYREYIQTKLIRPLQKGKTYSVEFYCRRNAYSGTNSNNLGVYFSTDSIRRPISYTGPLSVIPQINFSQLIQADNAWIKLSQCFTAQDTYEYLTIGNFYDDLNTKMEIAPLPNRDERPYYLLDDVAVTEISVSGLPPSNFLGVDTTLCPQQTVTLRPPAIDGVVYFWPNGSQSSSFTITQTGVYSVTATTGDCVVLDTIRINVERAVRLPPDTTICWGEELTLLPDHADPRYMWSNGSRDSTLAVSQTGTYSVVVPSRNCQLSDSIRVNVVDCSVSIPNVFTPNGDGKNDTFVVDHNPAVGTVWKLVIYNRWGRLVYQSNNYQNDWVGNDAPNGLYYYYLSDASQRQRYKGWVMVLR